MNRFRLGLSHLREHKLKHSFQDSINSLCNYGYKVKSAIHFFLHCPLFTNERTTLFSTLHKLDSNMFNNTDSILTNISIFGKESLNTNQNMTILIATMEFILSWNLFYQLRDSMSHFLYVNLLATAETILVRPIFISFFF